MNYEYQVQPQVDVSVHLFEQQPPPILRSFAFPPFNAVGWKTKERTALDENKVKQLKKQMYPWIAVDVDNKEPVGVYVSDTRRGLEKY